MAKSERQRQKKVDAKRRRDRAHRMKQAQNNDTRATLQDFRRKAAMLKRFVKQRGHEQKFYDFLDSYTDAFYREAGNAVAQLSSLLGIHEVEDRRYYGDHDGAFAASLGYMGMTQVFVTPTDVGDEYLAADRKSNVNGATVAYRDNTGTLKTLVLIRKVVPNVTMTECKYAFKLIALFHELGHVGDWEQGVNLREGDVAIFDAEVYAHLHALRRLMEGDYRTAISCYLPALQKLTVADGYQKVVADRVVCSPLFAQCEEFAKTNWSDYLNTEGMTQGELTKAAGSLSELQQLFGT